MILRMTNRTMVQVAILQGKSKNLFSIAFRSYSKTNRGVTSHLVAAGDTGLAISLTTPVNLLSEQKAARGKHSSGKSRPSRDLENQVHMGISM